MLGPLLKAAAQENVDAFSCQYIEAPTAEPFGDEEGHGISVRDYACEVTQGPLSGGVLTARAVWEMDKSGGRLLLGGGVIHKPGALAVLQLSEGKLEYVTTNGEVTEVRASGRGNYIVASGGAASLWTRVSPTSPRRQRRLSSISKTSGSDGRYLRAKPAGPSLEARSHE